MEQFGRYVLSERIASGGMAEIWRGALLGAAGFSKPLAIKRIRPDHHADQDFVKMFVDEARIASSLSHPNIVAVSDFGELDGHYFLAMDYVAGRHLGVVIGTSIQKKQPLPVEFGVAVVRDALLGLAHAHEKTGVGGKPLDIVHRDISPQNILVGFDGSARVADFGIAKALGRMTRTDDGAIKGKYGYMSPEQARGEDVDARSDIYAMGVVLWECLAGQRLYGAELEQVQVLQRVMKGQARPLDEVGRAIPPALVEIVKIAMAPDVKDRFQNAQAFARALSNQLAVIAPGWTAPDAARVMKQLFPSEIADEQARLAALESLARKMSQVAMPAYQEPRTGPMPPTVVTSEPRRKSGVAPVLGIIGLFAATGFAIFMAIRPSPQAAPVAMTTVVVESVPAGAAISVDGKPAGASPVRVRVPSGRTALVEAALEGYAPASKSVVAAGQQMVVLLDLAPR